MGLGRGVDWPSRGSAFPGRILASRLAAGKRQQAAAVHAGTMSIFQPERFALQDISGTETIEGLSIIFGCHGTE